MGSVSTDPIKMQELLRAICFPTILTSPPRVLSGNGSHQKVSRKMSKSGQKLVLLKPFSHWELQGYNLNLHNKVYYPLSHNVRVVA